MTLDKRGNSGYNKSRNKVNRKKRLAEVITIQNSRLPLLEGGYFAFETEIITSSNNIKKLIM